MNRISFFALGIFFMLGGSAAAQTTKPAQGVNCKDPVARPNVIYAAGSTALRPFLGSIAPLLASQSPPYTIVYQSQGSCTGVDAIHNADPAKRKLVDVNNNWAVYYAADGTPHECWLDVNGKGDPSLLGGGDTPTYPEVDLGVSDVFRESCNATIPSGVTIADYTGPIQPMTFVVNSRSKETAISADAAYLSFGLGGGTGKTIAPWDDPTQFYVRNAASGTQQMLARAIGVDASKWWGVNRGSSGNVVSGILAVDPSLADKAIGIVSTDLADANRGNMRTLAFKARGQTCAYLPDATINTKEKINVRDGHYPVWGPVHFFARTTGGQPSAQAAAFINLFTQTLLDPSLVTAISSKGLVPQCAMRVSRKSELGDLSPYTPPSSCACIFEKVANGGTSCKACNSTADCAGTASPACHYGFCEPQ